MPALALSHTLTYAEMCQREGAHLRRGMHFQLRGGHSVILMSVRPEAPYRDELKAGGRVLLYQGHDAPRSSTQDPRQVDQPALAASGRPTQNGLFLGAAQKYKQGLAPPELVQVYEKLRSGVWADNGLFLLQGAAARHDGTRRVFIFELHRAEEHGPNPGA